MLSMLDFLVWVSYPLKQGLKQYVFFAWQVIRMGLSQLSIKTRIETIIMIEITAILIIVWVSYPLKQGLKLSRKNLRATGAQMFESAIH